MDGTGFSGFSRVLPLALSIVLLCSSVVSLNRDGKTLLDVKSKLRDDDGRLGDWRSHDDTPCGWSGIFCDPSGGNVEAVDLTGFGVSGDFPEGFCQIPTLRNLSLALNNLGNQIQSKDLAACASGIRLLNLSNNFFVGPLPDIGPEFSALTRLDLTMNNFSGDVPASYGMLPSIKELYLVGNLLSGTFPTVLTNLTSLIVLSLAYNPFAPSILPPSIGNLINLRVLWLSNCSLVGSIPESVGKMVELRNFDLSHNDLSSKIPANVSGMRNVEQIELYANRLSGSIPETLGSIKSLIYFDVSQNELTGMLPDSVARLPLKSLNLNENRMYGRIPESLASNPYLTELKLFANNFSGLLPADLGRNSPLELLDVSSNGFEGSLPPYLCHMKKLQMLIVFENNFSGELPGGLSLCTGLQRIRMHNNRFNGRVPPAFWGLPSVYFLELSNNNFEGQIDGSISGARNLTQCLVSHNRFSGGIPWEICKLSLLSVVDASGNQLSGTIPSCLTHLKALQKLSLQDNQLSGVLDFSSEISSWKELTELNLSKNRLSGNIPYRLGFLPVLTYLDLSENFFDGEIPSELTDLKLNKLNLSLNNLTGKIPSGFDTNLYASSLAGNPGLCSQNLKPFRPCYVSSDSKILQNHAKTALIVTVTLCALAVVLLLATCRVYRTKYVGDDRRKSRVSRRTTPWKQTSFSRVGVAEEDVMAWLTEENLVGMGASGKVYRARLKTGETVAVKKLWDSGEPDTEAGFRAEIETLGGIRHTNIVKLLCCCVRNNVRLLVYEFMDNGSLGEALHGVFSGEEKVRKGVEISWERRMRAAIGAAQGLAYLHHDCAPPIVHRDVKSNNILLDTEFNAKVADFGLARMLRRCAGDDDGRMSDVAGSYGYIAPEYGYTLKVNETSDVYSFGVVLLELVTGKRPIDPSFGDTKDLVKWVNQQYSGANPAGLEHILDSRMPRRFHGEMVRVLELALSCTSSMPGNRPSMRRVVELLRDACKARLGGRQC